MNETLTAWPSVFEGGVNMQYVEPLYRLSNIFGISHGVILALFFAFGLVLGLVALVVLRSLFMAFISNVVWVGFGLFLNLLPWWTVPMFAIMWLYSIYYGGIPGDNPTSESTNVFVQFSWKRYGERLKRAYASKFGGANPGFNEEVDLRIAVMRTQGKGETRDMATLWLKNQAKFVEIPWQDLNDEASKEQVE